MKQFMLLTALLAATQGFCFDIAELSRYRHSFQEGLTPLQGTLQGRKGGSCQIALEYLESTITYDSALGGELPNPVTTRSVLLGAFRPVRDVEGKMSKSGTVCTIFDRDGFVQEVFVCEVDVGMLSTMHIEARIDSKTKTFNVKITEKLGPLGVSSFTCAVPLNAIPVAPVKANQTLPTCRQGGLAPALY